MTIIPFQDAADKIQKELDRPYTIQTIKNDIIREAYKIGSEQCTARQIESQKISLLNELQENSHHLSKDEKEKRKKDVVENFNKLSFADHAWPLRLSTHYKGFIWREEKEHIYGSCLKWDGLLYIRNQDILKFVGGEDIAVSLCSFTDRNDEQSYVTLKDHLSLSDIGLTLNPDGSHDERGRKKIISEKVAPLRQEITISKENLVFDDYFFEIIQKNLLSKQQLKSAVFYKHTGHQNDITDPTAEVAYSKMADGMQSGILPEFSDQPEGKKTENHNALKTWQKYMLCAAAIIATTNKKRYLHKQQKQQDKIFNYSQFELVFKEMAGRLLGTDSSISNSGYGLSDVNIAKILESALEKYPIDIDELWR
ncbi:MAG: hypothetical protein JZU65_12730 [Chlorobium sp.]|nr:hypothetical protein [Chlorobium sp.]